MSTTTKREIQEALSTHSRGNPWHTEEPRLVTMLYKIKNNLVDIAPEQCLTGGDYKTRGGEQKYKIISAKNNIYKFSFSPRTIMNWNYLPVTVAIAPDLDSFRSGLERVQFPPLYVEDIYISAMYVINFFFHFLF